MDREQDFAQRVLMYRELDALLHSRTRFFAAAALTNSALAQLFRLAPRRTLSDAYVLLSEAGTVLQSANCAWARQVAEAAPGINGVDELLVRREQRLLQSFMESVTARPCTRTRIQTDLNRLLNGQHWVLLGAPCLGSARRFTRILRSVRSQLGGQLDFNLESHRIQLGLGMVRAIGDRGPQGPPVGVMMDRANVGARLLGGSLQRAA